MSTAEPQDSQLFFMAGLNSPPLSGQVRRQAGFLLRDVQRGNIPPMPLSRPMTSIDADAHEIRLSDESGDWRVIYAIRPGIVVVVAVFAKKTRATPASVIKTCKRRLQAFDAT